MTLQVKLATTFTNSNIPTLWTPASISSDLLVWGKADAGVTLSSSGSRVMALADQSAKANTMSPTANLYSSAQIGWAPLLSPNAQNGLPCFANDGAPSTQRSLQSRVNPFPAAFTAATPFSIAVAFKRNALNWFTDALFHQLTMHNTYYYEGWGLFLGPYYGHGFANLWIGNTFNGTSTSQISVNGSTPFVAGRNYVLVITYNGSGLASGVTMTLNGYAETTTVMDDSLAGGTIVNTSGFQPSVTSGAVSSTGILSVGDSWGYGTANGDAFYEFMLVDRVLTSVEVSSVSSYLNQRWAIY